jgi:tetratricopeptide (TPR) repeat protein
VSAEALLSMGCLSESHGDLASAEKFYRMSLQSNPKLDITQNNLAMLLARKGERLDEALNLAQRAIDAGEEKRATFMTRSRSYRRKRADHEAAVRAIQTAVDLEPRNAIFRIRLATFLADSGQADRSADELKSIEELGVWETPSRSQWGRNCRRCVNA